MICKWRTILQKAATGTYAILSWCIYKPPVNEMLCFPRVGYIYAWYLLCVGFTYDMALVCYIHVHNHTSNIKQLGSRPIRLVIIVDLLQVGFDSNILSSSKYFTSLPKSWDSDKTPRVGVTRRLISFQTVFCPLSFSKTARLNLAQHPAIKKK